MKASSFPVEIGEIIAGKYRMERVVGAGAMGVVVEATNVALQQRVALKFLLSAKTAKPGVHDRFLREARAAARLKSEHVVRVMDVGVLETGAPYMVMEYLEGHDLAVELEQRGRLPVSEAADYLLQACEAIAEAHAAGIVHRDLKPANLFITRDATGAARVKVFDFGVSKVAGDELKLTAEGQCMGSPLYMSPEQMRGIADLDSRSDIWALGVILYELVTGTTPFHAESMVELMKNVLGRAPTPLATLAPQVPKDIETILLRCLEKDRSRRCPDVATFAGMLAPFAPPPPAAGARITGTLARATPAAALPSPLATASPVAATLAMTSTTSGTSTLTVQQAAPARSRVGVAVAVAVSLAVGLGVFARLMPDKAPAAASAPATPTPSAESPVLANTVPPPKIEPSPVSAPSAPSVAPVASAPSPAMAASATSAPAASAPATPRAPTYRPSWKPPPPVAPAPDLYGGRK